VTAPLPAWPTVGGPAVAARFFCDTLWGAVDVTVTKVRRTYVEAADVIPGPVGRYHVHPAEDPDADGDLVLGTPASAGWHRNRTLLLHPGDPRVVVYRDALGRKAAADRVIPHILQWVDTADPQALRWALTELHAAASR